MNDAQPAKSGQLKANDGEVTTLISELNHMADIINNNVSELEGKLDSVLRHEPSAETATDYPPMRTVAGDDLVKALGRINQANARLVDIRERTEL